MRSELNTEAITRQENALLFRIEDETLPIAFTGQQVGVFISFLCIRYIDYDITQPIYGTVKRNGLC